MNRPRIPVHTVQNLIWRFQALIIWGHLGLEKELLNPNIMGPIRCNNNQQNSAYFFCKMCSVAEFKEFKEFFKFHLWLISLKKFIWLLCTHEQLYFDVIGYFGCLRVVIKLRISFVLKIANNCYCKFSDIVKYCSWGSLEWNFRRWRREETRNFKFYKR